MNNQWNNTVHTFDALTDFCGLKLHILFSVTSHSLLFKCTVMLVNEWESKFC